MQTTASLAVSQRPIDIKRNRPYCNEKLEAEVFTNNQSTMQASMSHSNSPITKMRMAESGSGSGTTTSRKGYVRNNGLRVLSRGGLTEQLRNDLRSTVRDRVPTETR